MVRLWSGLVWSGLAHLQRAARRLHVHKRRADFHGARLVFDGCLPAASRNCNLRPSFACLFRAPVTVAAVPFPRASIHRLNVCSRLVTFSFVCSTRVSRADGRSPGDSFYPRAFAARNWGEEKEIVDGRATKKPTSATAARNSRFRVRVARRTYTQGSVLEISQLGLAVVLLTATSISFQLAGKCIGAEITPRSRDSCLFLRLNSVSHEFSVPL